MLPGELERVRLRHLDAGLLLDAGAAAPARDLADHPAGVAAAREREDVLGLGDDPVAVARQPRRLGACHGDRLDALELVPRERERLVER